MDFLAVATRRGITHETCDMTAEMLGQVSMYRLYSGGYVPKTGFEEGPKTIDVSTDFHELEATTKPETSRISNYSNGELNGRRTPCHP